MASISLITSVWERAPSGWCRFTDLESVQALLRNEAESVDVDRVLDVAVPPDPCKIKKTSGLKAVLQRVRSDLRASARDARFGLCETPSPNERSESTFQTSTCTVVTRLTLHREGRETTVLRHAFFQRFTYSSRHTHSCRSC